MADYRAAVGPVNGGVWGVVGFGVRGLGIVTAVGASFPSGFNVPHRDNLMRDINRVIFFGRFSSPSTFEKVRGFDRL